MTSALSDLATVLGFLADGLSFGLVTLLSDTTISGGFTRALLILLAVIWVAAVTRDSDPARDPDGPILKESER